MSDEKSIFCDNCKENDCEISLDGDCNMIRAYRRYVYLRNADIDAVEKGGIFAGKTPDNIVINGDDLDIEINNAMYA